MDDLGTTGDQAKRFAQETIDRFAAQAKESSAQLMDTLAAGGKDLAVRIIDIAAAQAHDYSVAGVDRALELAASLSGWAGRAADDIVGRAQGAASGLAARITPGSTATVASSSQAD